MLVRTGSIGAGWGLNGEIFFKCKWSYGSIKDAENLNPLTDRLFPDFSLKAYIIFDSAIQNYRISYQISPVPA
jgi:hypothetical protein